MNLWIATGRMVKDPESKVVGQKNTTMTSFTLAVERAYKQGETSADFINCTAFGKTAEIIEKYCVKGSKIAVEGELQNNNYKDKDGNMHYGMKVLVSKMEFLQSKREAEAESRGEPMIPHDDFMDITDGVQEELPFN